MLLLPEHVKEMHVILRVALTSVDLVSSKRGDIKIFVMEARNLGNQY